MAVMMRLAVAIAVVAVVAAAAEAGTVCEPTDGSQQYWIQNAQQLKALYDCETIVGSVVFQASSSFGATVVELPYLKTVTGSLGIFSWWNAGVRSMVFPSLQSVGGAVSFTPSDADETLSSVSFHNLTSAWDVEFGNLKALSTLDLSSLANVDSMTFETLPRCSASVPHVVSINQLFINAVAGVSFPALTSALNTLYVTNTVGMASFPVLQQTGNTYITGTPYITLPVLKTGKTIDVEQAMYFPMLQSVEYFSGTGVNGNLTLPVLTTATGINIETSVGLSTLDLSKLKLVYDYFQLSFGVKEILADQLQSVTGILSWSNLQLTTLESLATLTNVGGLALTQLAVRDLDGLDSLILVQGNLQITSNGKLRDIAAICRDTLNVMGNVDLSSNAALCCTSIDLFKSSAHVSGTVTATGCDTSC
eukprot:TRINITY_DN17604_c0_g1_i1.p2 TRINITY_DN17604_c0_g1~~TRINITY_DN17604_c0_g1_i1.p2  ORF type:complete len:440 (-),score=127.13 TRINITY_DN17604_c0_g1_i1:1350-2612(-)